MKLKGQIKELATDSALNIPVLTEGELKEYSSLSLKFLAMLLVLNLKEELKPHFNALDFCVFS